MSIQRARVIGAGSGVGHTTASALTAAGDLLGRQRDDRPRGAIKERDDVAEH